MAFPYVALTDDEKLESSLLSGLAENCDNDFRGNHITYTDTCTVGEDLKKHQSMDSICVCYLSFFEENFFHIYLCLLTAYTFQDLVISRKRSNPRGKTDLIVFCNGGFKDLDNAKSEGYIKWTRFCLSTLNCSIISTWHFFCSILLQGSCFPSWFLCWKCLGPDIQFFMFPNPIVYWRTLPTYHYPGILQRRPTLLLNLA